VSRRQMASGTPNNGVRETERENGISHVRAHVCEKRATEAATGGRVGGAGVKAREGPSEKKRSKQNE